MEGVCVKCTGVFDETLAILTLFPIIGMLFRKLHVWYHQRINHKCHHNNCNEHHLDHPNFSSIVSEWDVISRPDIEEKYGIDILSKLVSRLMILVDWAKHIDWFIDSEGTTLMAYIGDRTFCYSLADNGEWIEVVESRT